jgi:hypothetical protein
VLDAQPDFNPGWSDGTLRSTNGFNNISVYATSAVESLFGVGGQEGRLMITGHELTSVAVVDALQGVLTRAQQKPCEVKGICKATN